MRKLQEIIRLVILDKFFSLGGKEWFPKYLPHLGSGFRDTVSKENRSCDPFFLWRHHCINIDLGAEFLNQNFGKLIKDDFFGSIFRGPRM